MVTRTETALLSFHISLQDMESKDNLVLEHIPQKITLMSTHAFLQNGKEDKADTKESLIMRMDVIIPHP